MTVPIAVFAYNESTRLNSCVAAILASDDDNDYEIYLLANGCTDDTVHVASRLASVHSNVHVVEMPIGDKANTWNVFFHEVLPSGATYAILMDGDCRVARHALSGLVEGFKTYPKAVCLGAMPGSGRNRAKMIARRMVAKRLIGCLYSVNASFIEYVREHDIRIPSGAINDDGFVNKFAKATFGPFAVEPLRDTNFCFPSLRLTSWRDWKLYFRRRFRYSRMHFQNVCIKKALKNGGYLALPKQVDKIMELHAKQLGVRDIRWSRSDALFDLLTFFNIKKMT